jgi:putative membrane protein
MISSVICETNTKKSSTINMGSKLAFSLGLFLILTSLVAGYRWANRPKKINQAITSQKSAVDIDADFIRIAVASNKNEIRLAELALAKSSDIKLRQIASMVVKDHNEMLQAAIATARAKKISLVPMQKDPVEMRGLVLAGSGQEFDKKWCAEMIGNHEVNFQMLEAVWENSEDDQIKDLVSASLPHLISHLESLVEYQEHLGTAPIETVASEGQIAVK